MAKRIKKGKAILLKDKKPTKVPLTDLYDWVIWQFPRTSSKGAFAAIHPPKNDNGWYPAIIKTHKEQVSIWGHVNLQFSSPEEVLIYLSKNHSINS